MNSGADTSAAPAVKASELLTSAASLRAFDDAVLAEVSEAIARGTDAIVEVSLPQLDAYAALAAFEGEAVLWHSPNGDQGVGFGVAERLVSSGTGRFHELANAASALFERFGSGSRSSVRLYAGFGFAPTMSSARWDGFAAAEAILPLVSADQGPRGARMRVAVVAGAAPAILDTVRDALAALRAPAVPPTPPRREHSAPAGDYAALVSGVLSRVRDGEFRKVVAARRVDVTLSAPASDAAAITRLRDAYPDCHRFLFRRGGASFLGASPEALVRVDGHSVETVALAGSASSSAAGEAALRASAKDASEHGMVVDHVREALAPFCETLDIAPTPRLRRLRDLVHLETPVSGEMGNVVNVLRLAAMMHPTPAVGGVPTDRAMAWIHGEEGADRGWYSGPVGWFDASGHGELAVAIRSGLLRGSEASLWAGAGIVADSDPAMEDRETLLKLEPLLLALGIGE